MNMNRQRIILAAVCVVPLVALTLPTSAVEVTPDEGDLLNCTDGLYVVTGVGPGGTSSMWWSTQVGGSSIRVGFSNNQVGVKSTTINIDVTVNPAAHPSYPIDYTIATGVDVSDGCGFGPYETYGTAATPSNVEVDGHFSAVVTLVETSQGHTISHSESHYREMTISYSATESTTGGEITREVSGTIGYEETKSESFTSGSSISYSTDETQAWSSGNVPAVPDED